MNVYVPNFISRVLSVWHRNKKCYFKDLIANGLPPFLEPVLFLSAIGIGLGRYVGDIMGVKYSEYVASGLLASTAMFTATFEATYSAYFRMHYEKIYDAILSTPVGISDAFTGEVLWHGTKGFFFSSAVLVVISVFGMVQSPLCVFAPIVGFLTGIIYGALGLIVTSFVKDINNFNFYITGCCTPMFFISGVCLPVSELPDILQKVSYFIPLTHSVNLMRGLILGKIGVSLVYDFIWVVAVIPPLVYLAINCIRKRLIV